MAMIDVWEHFLLRDNNFRPQDFLINRASKPQFPTRTMENCREIKGIPIVKVKGFHIHCFELPIDTSDQEENPVDEMYFRGMKIIRKYQSWS